MSVVFAFVVTLVLVKVIDLAWGFCLEPQAENEGLDRSQHGEVGFDLSLAYEAGSRNAAQRSRARRRCRPTARGDSRSFVDGANPRRADARLVRAVPERPAAGACPSSAPSIPSSPPCRAIASASAAAIPRR